MSNGAPPFPRLCLACDGTGLAAFSDRRPLCRRPPCVGLIMALIQLATRVFTMARAQRSLSSHAELSAAASIAILCDLQALGLAGRGDIALAMAMREEEPSWGYMVKRGPGTIWETWNDKSNSHNHPMFTASIGPCVAHPFASHAGAGTMQRSGGSGLPWLPMRTGCVGRALQLRLGGGEGADGPVNRATGCAQVPLFDRWSRSYHVVDSKLSSPPPHGGRSCSGRAPGPAFALAARYACP